jgi:Mg2+ and Co2+ transporter CorA
MVTSTVHPRAYTNECFAGQFFTGYYGMNFIDPETGLPALPLLNAGGLGVVAFWCLALGSTGLVALMMYKCDVLKVQKQET